MRLMNIKPNRRLALVLGMLPFVVLVVVYLISSGERLAINPSDKLLPSPQAMAQSFFTLAFEPDKRTGNYVLWLDTWASLTRIAAALSIAAVIGLVIAMVIAIIPVVGALFGPFVGALSLVPPLALLPILFIALGLGEVSKITLIVIGVAPFMVRDLALRTAEMPRELVIKAQTLGANTLQYALRIVLPQLLPRLIDSLRLSLGPAWLFLISSEAIASESGLGYRIFLVRRFFAMDVIIPYVLWITLLAFLMDLLLRVAQRRLFPWFGEGNT
jgi:NitT/TauT family transport system permease protein